jgi:hypothetical protein
MAPGLGDEAVQREARPLPRIVLADANIFFAPRLRDLFMHLHEAEALSIHWTREIEDEWTRNVVVKQGADPEDLQRCLRGMRDAAEDWEVSGYTKYTDRFEYVDFCLELGTATSVSGNSDSERCASRLAASARNFNRLAASVRFRRLCGWSAH